MRTHGLPYILGCISALSGALACGSRFDVIVPTDGGTGNIQPDGGGPISEVTPPIGVDAAPDPQPIGPPKPVSKLDLLFVVDNSASMGTKQSFLKASIGALLRRFENPACVDANDPSRVLGTSTGGRCAAGVLEFKPVGDIHIGVITSSLGGRGSDACYPGSLNPIRQSLNSHNDDAAHLITRGGSDEHLVTEAATSGFLTYQTSGPAGPTTIANIDTLIARTGDLISGVGPFGCGFEAQLESMYRFLVQPDPYKAIVRNGLKAELDGVDDELLAQRSRFLRPDSAVGIVLLTDENESTVDPLAINAQAWAFENSTFPGSSNGNAPRATISCGASPLATTCTSCAFVDPSRRAAECPNGSFYEPAADQLGVRLFQTQRRFGLDPMFPLERYVSGLTQSKVPTRQGEHRGGSSVYTGGDAANKVCTNPLFAASLPASGASELCNLGTGSRTSNQIFFTVIGGVSPHLVRTDPTDPASPLKATLAAVDWTNILGNDPLSYDFGGADPHMLESLAPRTGLPDPSAAINADPVHGRERLTGNGDLQYACTFTLPSPLDCQLPEYRSQCSCAIGGGTTCDITNRYMERGFAYPTLRPLALAKALGNQSVVASICATRTQETQAGDPLYAYRPAMNALADKLRTTLVK